MRIWIIQSVACMGLGALLGFVVATRGMAPASRAAGVRHPVWPVAAETRLSDPDFSRPSSCPDRPASSVLLAQSDAKTTAAEAEPTAAGKKPNIVVIMEDVEEELVRRSLDFIDRSVKAHEPFFLWHNATRCHVWTQFSAKWKDKSGYGLYADAMMELD
jgi:hypothetical protein